MSNVQIGGRGGQPIPSSTLVAVDNVTITGDGSGQAPLAVIGSPGDLIQIPAGFGGDLAYGMPAVLTANGTGGVNHQAAQAGINNLPGAQPLGIVIPTASGGKQIQAAGIVTLTTAQWDAVIEGGVSSTGLTPGAYYYVGATAGDITTGVPAPGEGDTESTTSSPIGARLGFALSETELLLMIGGPPNTINLPAGAGAALGMPALIDEPSSTVVLTPSEANTAPASVVDGVIGYIDSNNNAIAFTNGMVLELTVAQWDARIGGSSGLTPGGTVWLSNTTPGGLLTTAPVTTGSYAVKIGTALTTTKLFVQITTPIGPHA
jgi:hypothetical protein